MPATFSMMDEILLEAWQADAVLEALAPEAAMDARAQPGQESTVSLFRRLTARGAEQFLWHPKVDERYQTLILRPDLTLEVWELDGAASAPHEDLATTWALAPVRARLQALAYAWGLQEGPLAPLASLGVRSRLSPLANRAHADAADATFRP